ncbi:hypothetical protein CALVIDRAFT_558105 [Calocera viscosa TUFC12733]|uniref:Uncharacterized protein n=1 Tax=Calocera viscosa (strain TUFC12733) TaxID=1330018 RepID=A0A167HG73_CALVF|nr:hypothetical protein CALVIDRAFT_558105 [Calocera viscosa TUFC12733]
MTVATVYDDTDLDIPGGSLTALRDFIVTLPSEPAEQLSMIEQVLRGASSAIRDPVLDVVQRLVSELPLVCSEEEFHDLMEGQGYESSVPFQLSEEMALPTYLIYQEMMECGPVPYCSDDGPIACSPATLECLNNFIRFILIPVQEVFVNQKAYAYMFGAVLYRMGMRLEGTAPNFALRAIRPVDVELRDQHAYIALKYKDQELFHYRVSTSNARRWRRQACYIFKDHCADVFARMELHRGRYLTAVRGHEHEHATAYMFDAIQLDTLVMSHDPIDVETNAGHYVRERELILMSRMIANKGFVTCQEAQIDLCIKDLALLKEQDLSRNGVRQLTGTPLYILTFDALLDIAKDVHELHRIVSKDLQLPAPFDLSDIAAWPTAEWLSRHGFNSELAKAQHDQR